MRCSWTRTALLLLLLNCTSQTARGESVANTDEATYALIPDLPAEHLRRFLSSFPRLLERCESTEQCRTVPSSDSPVCWGHEPDCTATTRFQTPRCPAEHSGSAQSKQAQITTFYYQADFGYIQQQIDELTLLCAPQYRSDSSLVCSRYLRFCRGRNLLFDFRGLEKRTTLIRYDMDVLAPGQLAGHCTLDRARLMEQIDHMGALQSWAPELRNFVEMPESPLSDKHCDLLIDKPTYLMKIDATYNMYHHFCDFFNLYASLYVNQSALGFHTDTQIIVWETYPYDSPFAETFKAFTHNPVWTLNEVKGKRVCLRNVVLPLLPRMIFGLYYNTPIIHGCQHSGLFRAFSEFILHRLRIPYHPPEAHKQRVRITFLSRRTTFRQVINEDELLDAIATNKSYYVRRISFERGLSFTEQLAVTRNSDILIGMHGAGLTHLLFLPNWATIFELHNCEDPHCYRDLARLRGVNYLTWQHSNLVYPQDQGQHPQGGAHAKFTNYAFDAPEFVRLVALAAEAVHAHSEYQALGSVSAATHGDGAADDATLSRDEL